MLNILLVCLLVNTVQLKKPDNVNAIKKDTTESKGILTKDPFLDATHYWPFETSHTVLTQDIVTGHNAILMDNADTENDDDIGEIASTMRNGSYVIAGDFKGTCFSDPGKCIMGGMTISFWVWLNDTKICKDQDAYIISSGGQSKKSRGFALLYFHGEYVACFSTADKQWKMKIKDLPQRRWINIAFVWKNNEQLTFYLNGDKKQYVVGTEASRPTVDYTILTISRPNNAVNREFMYPLKISSLALWDRPLKPIQIKESVNALMKIHKNPNLRRKRSKILRKAFNYALEKSKRHFIQHS